MINCTAAPVLSSTDPAIDLSGTVALYLMDRCDFTGVIAGSPLIAVRDPSASILTIANTSFTQAADASIISCSSRVSPPPTLVSCYMINAVSATSPLIALNGSVGTAAAPLTIRNCQLISLSSSVQSIIQCSNGSNYVYLEKNLFSSTAAAGSYIVNGSGTDVATYSADTLAGTVTTYSPSIITATLPLDYPTSGGSTGATGRTGTTGPTGPIGPTGDKTFIIDHPTDPARYLVHACIEGPEVGVYYRGSATLEHTSVTIQLPNYVPVFATNFTVQITPIYEPGRPIASYATTKVVNGSFEVYGPPGSFYWLVNASRGSLVTEPLKSEVTVQGSGPYRWIA